MRVLIESFSPHGHLARALLVLVAAACAVASSGAVAQSTEEGTPVGDDVLISMQRAHSPVFVPGQPIEITLVIGASGSTFISAMGVFETVPPGWTFQSMRMVSGPGFAVSPVPGDSGQLEFAWITSPQVNDFPVSFAYVVLPPEGSGGMQTLGGQVLYRQSGPELTSNIVVTPIEGPDVEPPFIQLNGPNPLSWPFGTPFSEPGWTASDPEDGDLSAQVQVSGVVNVNEPGRYTRRYTVSDSSGNEAQPQIRTVDVQPQVTPDDPDDDTDPDDDSDADPEPSTPDEDPDPTDTTSEPDTDAAAPGEATDVDASTDGAAVPGSGDNSDNPDIAVVDRPVAAGGGGGGSEDGGSEPASGESGAAPAATSTGGGGTTSGGMSISGSRRNGQGVIGGGAAPQAGGTGGTRAQRGGGAAADDGERVQLADAGDAPAGNIDTGVDGGTAGEIDAALPAAAAPSNSFVASVGRSVQRLTTQDLLVLFGVGVFLLLFSFVLPIGWRAAYGDGIRPQPKKAAAEETSPEAG